MRSYVWCELVCFRCSSTIGGRFTNNHIPRRELAASAKSAGWIMIEPTEGFQKDWCCNKCRMEI